MLPQCSLKNRTFSSKPKVYVPLMKDPRPSQYKYWNEERLSKAYEAIKNDGLSIRRAAEEYNVPKSTLHDRITGRVMFGATSGPSKYLSSEEEDELVVFLKGCSSMGFPRSRKEIIAIVQNVVNDKGRDAKVTNGWWESFKKRHPDLSLRNPEPLAHQRAVSCSHKAISKYFDLLERSVKDNNLSNKPSQIFNCDESGFPLDPSSPKVVVPKGAKHPYAVKSGNKAQVTVLACCSASGYVIPPLVIFDRKYLKPEMTIGEIPGSMYGLSDNGWIDGELFDQWFRHHFLAHAPPTRPLLLLLDGHSSHYTPSVISKGLEEGVIIFCLPPHSSHATQPLDRGVFASLKSCWKEECHKYRSANPSKVITRFSFCQIFNHAWTRGMTMHNVITGFRVTGVYPVNREVIVSPSTPHKVIPDDLRKKTGVSFVPLYACSPVVSKKVNHSLLDASCTFSADELKHFQQRYEEGYDVECDERYNQWLEMYHPTVHPSSENDPSVDLSCTVTSEEMPADSDTCIVTVPSTIMSKWIKEQPCIKIPHKEAKTSARILTSEESRKLLEEKERKKQEALAKKVENQRKRQEKQQEKGTVPATGNVKMKRVQMHWRSPHPSNRGNSQVLKA